MKSPTRKRLAAAAALALGAGAAVSLTSLPAQAQEVAAYPIVDGSITWGVKESFRSYVTGSFSQGTISVLDGAQQNDDGTFEFGSATGVNDLPNQALDAAAEGGVNFAVPIHGIDITLENLYVEMDLAGYTGTLFADVAYGTTEADDVPIVDIDAGGQWTHVSGFMTLTDAPTALTAEAVPIFQNYAAGAAMDPITIAVKTDMANPIDDEPTDDPTSDTPSSEAPSDDPSSEDPAGDATVYAVTGGAADWGVKESYRQYVVGPIANGEITLTDPATENGDGTYRFPEATGTFTAETCAVDAAFAGGVNFYGHEGEMDLDIAGLSVKSTDGALALYSGGTLIANVAVAELAVEDGAITVDGAPATVSADGVDFFGGFYEEGEALDPVSFDLELADAPDTTCEPTGNGNGGNGNGSGSSTSTRADGAGTPKLPKTGSPLTFVLAAAAALLAGGIAVTVVARRRALQADA
ncbi:HtaA domain-containing protein [Glycomyces sp. NPDC048151]|uniref:HtaA domain-containing protein n=1 Tax=Glycomyces sp. NPDC048151 TaxID=3364002 RepID=UPI003721D105